MGKDKTLTIWSEAPGNYSKIIKSAALDLQSEISNLSISLKFEEWENYVSKLKDAFRFDQAPDIFSMEPGGPLRYFAKKGLVNSLDEFFKEEIQLNRFYSIALDSVRISNNLYALPISMNNMQLFINSGLAECFDIKIPKTIKDLLNIAANIKPMDIECIATGFRDRWAGVDMFVVLVKQLDKEGNLLRYAEKGLIPWTNTVFVKAMQTIKEMAIYNVFCTNAADIAFHNEALDLWIRNNALFLWPGNNSILLSIPENISCDAIWFPSVEGGDRILTGGVALAWSLSSKTESVDLAIRMLKKMIDDKRRKMFLTEGISPSGRLSKNIDINSKYPIANKINSEQEFAKDRRIYEPGVYNALGEMVRRVVLGEISPIEALENIQMITSN